MDELALPMAWVYDFSQNCVYQLIPITTYQTDCFCFFVFYGDVCKLVIVEVHKKAYNFALFCNIKDQIGVDADKAIHVGDDEQADKGGANAVGIDCWFVNLYKLLLPAKQERFVGFFLQTQ